MDFSYLLNKYDFKIEKLIELGFIKTNNIYSLTIYSKIDNSFKYLISINDNRIIVDCYDKESNELYIPFSLKNNNTKYVLSLKEEITNYLINSFNKVFNSINIKKEITGTKYYDLIIWT